MIEGGVLQKIKEYGSYCLAGMLGLFTFIFSACSGLVWHWDAGMNWRATQSTYKFMDFIEDESAYNSAGAFEILLIILSVALMTFAVIGILNKMGKTKISLGKLKIEDLIMYITFAYVLFALAQVISVGALVGQNSELFTDSYYFHIGAGPLLMFFSSVALLTYQIVDKWIIKDKKTTKTAEVKSTTAKTPTKNK